MKVYVGSKLIKRGKGNKDWGRFGDTREWTGLSNWRCVRGIKVSLPNWVPLGKRYEELDTEVIEFGTLSKETGIVFQNKRF